MLRSIFGKTLYDRRRGLIGWSLGITSLVLVTMLFYPTIRAQGAQLQQLVESLPKGMLAALGMLGEGGSLLSPAGYLRARLFTFMAPLLFLILGIGTGAAAIAGEEERKTLDLLLANPISRRALVLQTWLAMLASLSLIGLVFWLVLALAAPAVEMDIGPGQLAAATISVVLLGMTFGSIALAIGAVSGNRGLSIGVSSVLAISGYLINSLAPLIKGLQPFQPYSLFYQYTAHNPLESGLHLGHAGSLLGVAVVVMGVGMLALERRDVSV